MTEPITLRVGHALIKAERIRCLTDIRMVADEREPIAVDVFDDVECKESDPYDQGWADACAAIEKRVRNRKP